MTTRYSDEYLNIFIDNELRGNEKAQLLEAVSKDPELRERVNQLRVCNELVRHAYDEPPRAAHAGAGTRWQSRHVTAMAASIVLAVGILIGWFGNVQYQLLTPDTVARNDETHDALLPQVIANSGQRRIVLHLRSAELSKAKAVLDEADSLLRAYAEAKQPLQLEVVADLEGVQLLNANTSPYSSRVQTMAAGHDNLAFVACMQSMSRLDEPVRTIPQVIIVPVAADDHLPRRLQEGWTYVRI